MLPIVSSWHKIRVFMPETKSRSGLGKAVDHFDLLINAENSPAFLDTSIHISAVAKAVADFIINNTD